ncbi:tRNA (adenosine(37)-N6)-threonylcarbamoyltransferase complex dimerization subunit type 1 TsaB [Microlunatus sp. Gsoil 973]|uniref:tRNA (adenosine(37)-N6)-threonylcarbamoyltransferase complex dimerization subunit type 1 TsaB n=1 Tax=Microlunatus sp. Gsoil 973 TaxID=2672569 RepID=UPI0012B44405|nr:tRNA (adenosine(37)-N6)-threonylcarbamoyltransferase complex dimerization subunit type 1 TsaB [Microlunatus sp. Gsoil 973]QGN35122.1 tRNA (adenosine(37)-N6)-threonylcarbamoyltransferase complex dimerization subunit type 1 TsaB [Microlunatus sp. Gsoil 973]
MTDQLILGLDTSTQVAVGLSDGERVLARRNFADARQHVEQLAPLVSSVITEAGVELATLTGVVVGVGPGPYTGLRVGIATARMLGSALGVPVHGVCSLDVFAAQWLRTGRPGGEFVIATDARRREVYWARYDIDGRRIEGPAVGRPDRVPGLPVGGPATLLYPDLPRAQDAPSELDGGILALAGTALPDAGIEPLYLRRPDAAPPGPRKSVLAHPRALR